MSVADEVRNFIHTSLAEDNKPSLDQFWNLVAESAKGIKHSSIEAADEQSREIKKMRRQNLKSFKCTFRSWIFVVIRSELWFS